MIATITRKEHEGDRKKAWRHSPGHVDLMTGPMFRDDTQTEPVEPGDPERPTDVMVVCSLALTADDLDMADTIREAPRKRLAAAVRAAKRDDGDGAEHTDRAALRAALRGTPEIMSGMAKKRSARERRR